MKVHCNSYSPFQIRDSFTCERTTKFDPEENNNTSDLENKQGDLMLNATRAVKHGLFFHCLLLLLLNCLNCLQTPHL